MASAGAASAVHLENAVQANLPITTNTTFVPEFQCIWPDITTPVKPSSVKSRSRTLARPEIPLDENTVSRDLAYAVVFRRLWFYLSLMVRWRGVDL